MANYHEDENGYVTFPDTPLSKPGIFEYMGREISPTLEPERVYKVWRPAEELNNPDTIESFKLAPWFPRHEMSGEGFTDAEQIGVQGTTGQDVRYLDGIGLVGTVKTFGTQLKKAIKTGLRELSCGFRCRWDIVSGVTPDGLKYDVVQRDIRGNHLASVDQGRMGADVAVAMDRACIALDNVNLEGDKMTLEEILKAIAEGGLSDDEKKALKAKIDEMIGGMESNEEEREEGESEDECKDEDMAEDVEAEADAEAEDEEKPAMDSATAKRIADLEKQVKRLQGSALDANAVEAAINAKNALIQKLEPHVGRINGTGLDANGVAGKAAKILGIACDSGSALAAVTGYLHAAKSTGTTVDRGTAQDSAADAAISKTLDELGL